MIKQQLVQTFTHQKQQNHNVNVPLHWSDCQKLQGSKVAKFLHQPTAEKEKAMQEET